MSTIMLCTVCIKKVSQFLYLQNLFYDDNIPVNLFINDILHIKMEQNSATLIICNTCNHVLNNFYQFYKMVKQAHQKLNEIKTEVDFEYFDDSLDNGNNVKEHNFECNIKSSIKEEISNMEHEESNLNLESNVEFKIDIKDELISDSIIKNKIKVKKKTIKKCDISERDMKCTVLKRIQSAMDVLCFKYKLEEMCQDGKWILNENQMDEIICLFVDLKCHNCPFLPSFSSYKELLEHTMQECGEVPVLRCCERRLNRDKLETHILYRHVLKQKIPRTYACVDCPVCGKSVRRMTIKLHLSSHLPHSKREFQCDVCHSGFGSKGRLAAHMKAVHPSNILPSVCDECGKTCKSPKELQLHKRVHVPLDNQDLCPECGKRVKCRVNFINHMNTHRGINNRVKCHICSKIVKKVSLPNHMRNHDPKNIKQCPHCTFKSTKLREHILRVHEKVKPFPCTFCQMKFMKRRAMEDHVASRHTGIPRYTCEYCSKTFMTSGNYHTHRKRMHPKQLAEKRRDETKKKDVNVTNTLELKSRIVEDSDPIIRNIQEINKKIKRKNK